MIALTEKELIRLLLYQNRMSQEQLAEVAGYKGQTSIAGLLNNERKGMRMDIFLHLIHVMGYKMVVTNKDRSITLVVDGVSRVQNKGGMNDD